MAKLYVSEEETRVTNMARGEKSFGQIPYQPVRQGQTVIRFKKEGSEPKGQEFKLTIKTAKQR